MNRTQLAARIYDMRDAARTLLGANYTARMSDLGSMIRMNAADRLDKDVLLAAMDMCTTKNLQSLDLLFVMVAAVELIEPSDHDLARNFSASAEASE